MKTNIKITLLVVGIIIAASCSKDDDKKEYEEVMEVAEVIEPKNEAPAATVLVTPEDTAELISEKPTLTWEAATDPESDTVVYDIYMGASADRLSLASENLSDTSYEIETSLEKGADYFWQIKSKDAVGNTSDSEIFTFKTAFVTSNLLIESAPFSKRRFSTATVFNEEIWLIGGEDESGTVLSDIWKSSDGITWTLVTEDAAFGPRNGHATIVFDNKIWVYNGSDGRILNTEIWSSEDGITWVLEENDTYWNRLPFNGQNLIRMFVFDSKLWRFAAYNGLMGDVTNERNIWNSSDGKNWTLVSENHGFDVKYGMGVIPFQGKLIGIDLERVESTNIDKIRVSTDGISWDLVSEDLPFKIGNFSDAIVKDNRLYVIAGTENRELWFTEDGIAWQKAIQERGFSTRSAYATVVFDNKIYVVAGGTFRDVYNEVWVID